MKKKRGKKIENKICLLDFKARNPLRPRIRRVRIYIIKQVLLKERIAKLRSVKEKDTPKHFFGFSLFWLV